MARLRLRNTLLAVIAAGAMVACSNPDSDTASVLTGADELTDTLTLERAEELTIDLIQSQDVSLLDGVDAVWTKGIDIDKLGMAHTRLIQTVDNIPVFGGEAIVHLTKDGTLKSITDDFKRHIQVDTRARLTDFEAIDLAIGQDKGYAELSETPEADLQVLRHQGRDYLTYRVQLRYLRPDSTPSMPVVFIDAHTGDQVWRYDNLQTYALSDADKITYDLNNSTNYNNAVVGDSSDSDLLETHNSVGQTLDFLLTQVGRDSYNGNGAVVKSYGHYSNNYVNAFWDGTRLTFGDGDNSVSSYLGVLDVSAHELGHAVTTYSANLTYSSESGALNEGSSDILGAAVEAYVDGGVTQDAWDIGEDCWLADPALRYMSHPSDDGSSRDHYSNRYTGSSDNGGVHWNSGIANHFFYLLSAGGKHHNPAYQTGNTVAGIGIDAAYQIWYRALTAYMNSSTNFAGARTATESACADLYSAGTCASVGAAWDEVGVGGGGTPPPSGGCPAGYSSVSGTLSGTGDSDTYTYSTFTGVHDFILHGPTSADFDLYLYRGNSLKASSTSPDSEEEIHYSGSANKIVVDSWLGGGDYVLCYEL